MTLSAWYNIQHMCHTTVMLVFCGKGKMLFIHNYCRQLRYKNIAYSKLNKCLNLKINNCILWITTSYSFLKTNVPPFFERVPHSESPIRTFSDTLLIIKHWSVPVKWSSGHMNTLLLCCCYVTTWNNHIVCSQTSHSKHLLHVALLSILYKVLQSQKPPVLPSVYSDHKSNNSMWMSV